MAELSSSELDPESLLSSTLNGSGAAPTARRAGTGRRLLTKQSRAESTGLLTWRTGVIFSQSSEGKHQGSAEPEARESRKGALPRRATRAPRPLRKTQKNSSCFAGYTTPQIQCWQRFPRLTISVHTIEWFRIAFTANGKSQFIPRESFPFFLSFSVHYV